MNKCIECEKEALLSAAEFVCKNERLEAYCALLEDSLRGQTALNKFLIDENENLRNLSALYQQTIKNLREKYEKIQED